MKNKKYGNGEFYTPVSKPTFITSEIPSGYCKRMPGAILKCMYNGQCQNCEYAEQTVFKYAPPEYPVLDKSSVLPYPKGKAPCYYRKVVALKPEAMEKLGYRKTLYFQLFYCIDGYGCLPNNTVWEIDGHLIAEPNKLITVHRSDILGIPCRSVYEKYDEYFFTNTVKKIYKSERGDVI